MLHDTNCGIFVDSFISTADLSKLGKENAAKMGPTPTSIEGMRLAMGHKVEVANYRLGKTGPHKDGKSTIDPKGQTAWLEKEKTQWGWKRDPGWTLGVRSACFCSTEPSSYFKRD